MAAKVTRWQSCNVLAAANGERVLWRFARRGASAEPVQERRLAPGEKPPADQVGKTLRHFWQPRLNIAWFPSAKVFIRVVELPTADPKEAPALIEFQLDKLSPLPAGQAAWTFETLPAADGQNLAAVVLMAERGAVEAFLGELDGAGYRTDRLELPLLRELLALGPQPDGLTLLAAVEDGRVVCLSAWWSGRRLKHVSLLPLTPDEHAPARLVESLRQTTWAAELEGWLPERLDVTLVAAPETAASFEPALQAAFSGAVRVQSRRTLPELAADTACAAPQANLVPPDIQTRYRQDFVDRLWMRVLGVAMLIYVFGVLGYLAALSIVDYLKARVDHQIALQSTPHTKALQLKARVEVLQEQVNLKFAALDCWKAAAEALPESLTLNAISFQRGKKLGLIGSVPNDQQARVTEYNEALAKAAINGRPLFSKVSTKSIQAPPAGRADQAATWSLECEINRSDLP